MSRTWKSYGGGSVPIVAGGISRLSAPELFHDVIILASLFSESFKHGKILANLWTKSSFLTTPVTVMCKKLHHVQPKILPYFAKVEPSDFLKL